MYKSISPDIMISSVYEATPDFFMKLGITAVIFDIDNTLVPDGYPVPDTAIEEYIAALKFAGIKLGIVSNNSYERVSGFAEALGISYSYKSGKPKKRSLSSAISAFDTSPSHIALVGDQIFTDIAAAKRNGILSVLVKPIDTSLENRFFKIKRFLEKPIIASFIKNKNGKEG